MFAKTLGRSGGRMYAPHDRPPCADGAGVRVDVYYDRYSQLSEIAFVWYADY